uniref:CobW family GTP-binding protein n=1 Tax=Ningiella ruwaisensis TaxID=2364274 RepID=UPI0010A01A25|nr:GTP-binding protein [Ningiella ruwaisensis]
MQIIKAVPTNIITGALGAGKTTFIKALLLTKPKHERWAVLVNEFGEIGIDGALLNASVSKDAEDKQAIFIREIPGGCMCCASGLPMQIALNQLLAQAKPHRLLVEPTGLGHPKEVIDVFTSKYYQDVIALKTTFCLSDARKLQDARWRNHPTFKEQFEIADHIMATKADLYNSEDEVVLRNYLSEIGLEKTALSIANHGVIDTDIGALLSQNSRYRLGKNAHHLAQTRNQGQITKQQLSGDEALLDEPISSSQVVYKQNESEGFYTIGWIWPASYCFEYRSLTRILNAINAIRVKAVMITNEGIFNFNCQGSEACIFECDEAMDSRLEIILNRKSDISQTKSKIETIINTQNSL